MLAEVLPTSGENNCPTTDKHIPALLLPSSAAS